MIFPTCRGIMAEIEYPGVAQLVGRDIWDVEVGCSSHLTRAKIPLKSAISEGFFLFFVYCGAGGEYVSNTFRDNALSISFSSFLVCYGFRYSLYSSRIRCIIYTRLSYRSVYPLYQLRPSCILQKRIVSVLTISNIYA